MAEKTKRQYVNELKVKDNIDDPFLIKFISLMEGRDGRAYLNVILSDYSGDIEARCWSSAEKLAQVLEKGHLAEIKGKVNLFQGRKQVVIQEMVKVESNEDYDLTEFYPRSPYNAEEMYQELLQMVSDLDDIYIRTLLQNILNDTEIARRLQLWPAGKSIHHPYQSGLLEHILSCSRLALFLSPHFRVNKNFVLAGAILHDLCKIYELSSGLSVDYTEEGKLVGHLVKGLEVVDRFTYKIKNFPYNTKTHLKHILLSHHGDLNFGSPKVPQTKEAYLVHLIDLMDSKMASLDWICKTDSTPGHWSGFIKHLDRLVFKGDLPHYTEWIVDDSKDHP